MSIAKVWAVNERAEVRYRERVTVPDDPDACWGWKGAIAPSGYPVTRAGGNARHAHRVSWIIANGLVPEGFVIDHLCRNIICSNPRHLEAVTQSTNVLRGVIGTKTHCKFGHLIDGMKGRGKNRSRYCRTCHNARLRARYRAKVSA